MVFHCSLCDSKSPLVFRTLLGILADPNNPVVWVVSTRPLIFNSSNLLTKTLGTVPNPPITTGTAATLLFYSFLAVGLNTCLSFQFFLFSLYYLLERQNLLYSKFSFLFFFFFFC